MSRHQGATERALRKYLATADPQADPTNYLEATRQLETVLAKKLREHARMTKARARREQPTPAKAVATARNTFTKGGRFERDEFLSYCAWMARTSRDERTAFE